MFSHCFLDFSVGVGAFVIGRSQISSFFTYKRYLTFFYEIIVATQERPQSRFQVFNKSKKLEHVDKFGVH